ncbi:MAG: hypothetical protein Fur0044_36820 [Anaerolineae bacterium]|nr:hypothetical protein [Anaerolineales bacterium]MCQ3974109.1 hypothetical protein [Anaerolineae bacterium]
MAVDELIQAKKYRLEELKKYQAYYGPNTPYPVIVEINDLEAELQRLTKADKTRATPPVKKRSLKKKKSQAHFWEFGQLSGPTKDAIATIAFIGLVFLFGSIVFAAYVRTRPRVPVQAPLAYVNPADPAVPTLRPTFTPTSNPNQPLLTEGASDSTTYLPTPGEVATEVPTPVPTLTPSATVPPTAAPLPTDTPEPISLEPEPPSVVAAQPAVAPAAPAAPAAAPVAVASTPEPEPTVAPPAPEFPFAMVEQGNREFQRTNYHVITIYVAAVSAGNVPIGGIKVVGDHVPSGRHAESGPSDWNWSAVNCLECDYIKQGNVKFEPGTFEDGVWNIYLADQSGTPLSPVVPLSYSADPEKWVWDFVLFRKNS